MPYIKRATAVEQQRGGLRTAAARPAVDNVKIIVANHDAFTPIRLVQTPEPVANHPKVMQPTAKLPEKQQQPLKGHVTVSAGQSTTVAHTKAKSLASSISSPTPNKAALGEPIPDESEGLQSQTLRRRILRFRRTKKMHKTPVGAYIAYGMAGVMIIAGGIVTVQGALLNQQLREQVKVLSASTQNQNTTSADDNTTQASQTAGATDIPSETKPKANYLDAYKVAADLPRLISIPNLNLKARVLQVGIDSNNELLTPKSIYDTAWYTGSAKPGQPGTAVIDGHYVGPTTNGVFSRIDQLKSGDIVTIEMGNGAKLNFRVTGTETVSVDKVDMMKVLAPNDKQSAKLNLITCGGRYDSKTFHFSDRTIVYTELVK